MNQEQIFFEGQNQKTSIKFFTNYTGQTSDDNKIYYVIADLNHTNFRLVESLIDTQFVLDNDNYYVPFSSAGYKIYTGSVIHNESINVYTEDQKNTILSNYVQNIQNEAIQNSTNISNIFSTVFFEDSAYSDYYLNVKINRSVDTLDTLNVYNIPYNDGTKFTNDTGVLYGKIEAIQVLLDDSGNNLRIPIKNASIGIFSPSDEFPYVGSVDQNGNRIRLNLFENIQTNNLLQSYGSFQSFLTDVKNSPKDYENDTIPAKYKYTTVTNDYGEFVLHGIPVGQQTLMIEIDLLKQGLEPEEVALNFFPYSTLDEPNVSNIPHLYFNQFPVNIVPSWGEIQTGYTEIDLAVVLDLRKWITYYTYPISAKVGSASNISNNINQSPKILEELNAVGITNPFTVFVRDMTKPFNVAVPPKIELVKIVDIYDKNLEFKSGWNEEFKTKGNKIDFYTSGYNAFKLPANLYDPNGTNTNGNLGVWLGAYQIKTAFPNQDISYQATGYQEEWPTDENGEGRYYKANHYDLNRYDYWYKEDTQPLPGSGIGKWPYEKPWSLKYPEDYIITKKPSVPNPLKKFTPDNNPILNVDITNRNGVVNNYQLTSGQFFTEPRFLDGDMVGGSDAYGTNANGYGLQNYNGVYGGNDFSREITKNEIWRYEGNHYWGEEWSNGYCPGLTPYGNFDKYPDSRDGKPDIYGEKWQRLEAGFAYWLRPRGWPRVKNENWGDHLLENDYNPLANHDYDSIFQSPIHYKSYFFSIYNYIDEVTLQVGANSSFLSQFGGLSIYRVEKPYYTNPKKPPFTAKFARFHIQEIIIDQSKDKDSYEGDDQKIKKICYPDNGTFGGAKCGLATGNNNTANAFIWLEKGGRQDDGDNNTVQQCNIQFSTTDVYGGVTMRIVNIGTTNVNINGTEVVPGNYDKGINVTVYRNSEIILPANDKYNPTTNSYEGASYLFYVGTKTNAVNFTRGGGLVQPVYRYKVGIQGEEVNYYLTSLIPREVGCGSSKCNAVADYDDPSGFSIPGIGGFLNLLLSSPAIALFVPRKTKNEVFAALRDYFSSAPLYYTSKDRRDANQGVFINGMSFCIAFSSYVGDYINARLKPYRSLLPYVGEEVAESAAKDFRIDVPFQGSWWFEDYLNHVSGGNGLMAFQPKPILENNLKGTKNMYYFMEVNKDLNGTNVVCSYEKAF
jgi:hypothetical protein